MLTREELGRVWLKKAKERSIEKFGFNLIGVDLDKLKESLDELRIRK